MTTPENAARALTIAEAAEATGLTAHTLRYYERAGLLESVDRTAGSLGLVEWKVDVYRERLGGR